MAYLGISSIHNEASAQKGQRFMYRIRSSSGLGVRFLFLSKPSKEDKSEIRIRS